MCDTNIIVAPAIERSFLVPSCFRAIPDHVRKFSEARGVFMVQSNILDIRWLVVVAAAVFTKAPKFSEWAKSFRELVPQFLIIAKMY